jgi:hypothetical protein
MLRLWFALQKDTGPQNSKQIFPEMKLRGLVPAEKNRWKDRGNIYTAHRYMCKIGNRAAQFHFWKHINRIFSAVWVCLRYENMKALLCTCDLRLYGIQAGHLKTTYIGTTKICCTCD